MGGQGSWNIASYVLANAAVLNAVYAIGAYYPSHHGYTKPARGPGALGERGRHRRRDAKALSLAKLYNRNYIIGKVTKSEIWSPVTAYYDLLAAPGSGLMRQLAVVR